MFSGIQKRIIQDNNKLNFKKYFCYILLTTMLHISNFEDASASVAKAYNFLLEMRCECGWWVSPEVILYLHHIMIVYPERYITSTTEGVSASSKSDICNNTHKMIISVYNECLYSKIFFSRYVHEYFIRRKNDMKKDDIC